MKRTYLYVVILALVFTVMIFSTINKFNGVREQYKTIEPNLDNYSTAEITMLAFERMKVALLSTENNNEFLIRKKIFDSKIKILENKSDNNIDFFYDNEFLILIKKIRNQSEQLSMIYSANANIADRKLKTLSFMNDMQPTLTDLQEVIYRIQISHFYATKNIIKDNSTYTKYYALLCIFLSFILIMLLWRHITKLKETLLKKNIFISAIYHELSSSIQKIQLSSEMIDIHNDVFGAARYINNIKLHSNKIFHQTREILEYSKIEIGNIQLNESTFYLNDLLHEVASSFDNTNGNAVSINCTSKNRRIRSDKQKLLSIIINLLDNANKNTKNGTIYLSLKLVDSFLYLYVKDNGCGFDIKNINTLYRPFNQGAEKETRQGLGLGLTIIKNYVKIFNGKIRARSRLNMGSTFLVRVAVEPA
ncbi:HAMP domain-containing histidine kinase [Erwinia amylovora]|uniref:sensor histidine kinase n=1 Tax=Erwinia amylovora TaxID=552 RepID=UPI000C06FFE5|nr:HAMP domain-containing sensor histidine kinase [Erwinia amylovora]UDJ85685.1 HAMP domain-containing histidine kinase [Erwinia amylovora]UDK00328.1 HAMP domain-containing histidine kinase [Erwinia amylovora]UDK90786.1 HAMP domain-containing histidine kinase [Erwinia amylovora]UDK94181.1 HAMP domain-containing histidine kinase [Erwinia amylovora]UOD75023.1 HAMP domain-containing histidine kinase [Erwinia amylovora]